MMLPPPIPHMTLATLNQLLASENEKLTDELATANRELQIQERLLETIRESYGEKLKEIQDDAGQELEALHGELYAQKVECERNKVGYNTYKEELLKLSAVLDDFRRDDIFEPSK